MLYAECRWPQIAALDKDRTVVVCPLASIEQHGHHLPLVTDTCLVTGVAERVHEQLPDRVLLVPTLWLGASDHHLDFPGTVTVPNSLYVEMIKQITRSFVRAGFKRIFFLNGHGGNVAPGETAITEMANECDDCDAALIALGSYWTVATPAMTAQQHGMATAQLTHACEYETSMMLYLRGDLVSMKDARGTGDAGVLPSAVRMAGRFHRRTATGALGQPEHATADKGASLMKAIVAEVTAAIRHFADTPLKPVLKPAH